MMLTGSEIICECLIEQGVDTVFGYPGGTILNVYDALYRYQDKINHVLTSHEQGASHAADGYARATGKVGVCMATSGPGATNLVTGIATAYMDSTPLVAITANVGVEILGRDSFQEIDITGVTMPITKHNFIVKDIKDLVPTIRKAFYIAKEGRPGPVLVDVTKNVTAEKMEFEPLQPKAIEPKTETYTVEDLDQAIEIIKESEKPFIFAGGGVISSGASQELKEFAAAVTERFKNPFIDHALLAISLNSTSKWKARVMPSLKEYIKRKGTLPSCITASFAFYIAFFHGHTMTEDGLLGSRPGNDYLIKDDQAVLDFYLAHKDDSCKGLVHAVCTNTDFWGEDLTKLEGFEAAVCTYLTQINENGTYAVMKTLLK